MSSADRRAAAHASRQHGVFTRAQLVADGVSVSTIRRRTLAGIWTPIGRSAYRFTGAPHPIQGRLLAATLSVPDSFVSHVSAALLHGMAPLPADASERTELTRIGDSHTRHPGWTVRRTQHIDEADWAVVDGIRCTSAARTLIDLATVLLPRRYTEVVAREVLLRQHHGEVEAALSRLPPTGKAGTRQARQVLHDHLGLEGIATSELERRFLLLAKAQRLPSPSSQFLPPWRTDIGHGVVDFAYPAGRLLVEVDGRTWHALARAFEADRQRDQNAIAHGWRTLRFTWAQIVHDPVTVATTILAALTQPQAA